MKNLSISCLFCFVVLIAPLQGQNVLTKEIRTDFRDRMLRGLASDIDTLYLLDSFVCQTRFPFQTELSNQVKVITAFYDQFNLETCLILQSWQNDEWVNSTKDSIERDENGEWRISYSYSWENGQWMDELRSIRSLDTEGRDSIIYTEVWNLSLEEWRPSMQELYSHEGGNQKTTSLTEIWDEATLSWKSRNRSTFIRNDLDFQESFMDETWRDSIWLLTFSVERSYLNDSIEIEKTTLSYDQNFGFLSTGVRERSILNEDLQLDSSTVELLQVQDSIWENRELKIYTYDESTLSDTILEYNWAIFDEFWVLFEREIIDRVEDPLAATTLTERWDGISWNNQRLKEELFTPNGQLLKTTTSAWENLDWSIIQNCDYYYQLLEVVSTQELSRLSNCLLANPLYADSRIECPDLSTKNNYQINIYDLLGRSQLQMPYQQGMHLGDLSKFTDGMYLLTISGQEGLVYRRKIWISN
ncbi:MAG: T9SS type A sorting domain-containing protein [Bacteroidota bacterium]